MDHDVVGAPEIIKADPGDPVLYHAFDGRQQARDLAIALQTGPLPVRLVPPP